MHTPWARHILYGADYNPEQWSEDTWREDMRLMREAGVNFVSLSIFSWAQLEPSPGHYQFDWLDRVMDLLHTHGIQVDLATATASPPPWLASLHPESLPVRADGTILWPGGRQQYCPSSTAYREAITALVERMAERYGSHPALALWHIGNEYGCHVPACYCDGSAAAFRAWLQRRYGTIAALNEAWATTFWSQRYGAWEEINPPRTAPTYANPTQQLDYARFSSDALLECFRMERDILKRVTPDVPVTTNFLGFLKGVDYWAWAPEEDVVANDSYPDPADSRAHVHAAMEHDLMRSLGGGRPWLLTEQTPSAVNWREQNVLKRPGQMRLWSMQAVARGADGIMFFQWRASKAGAEKFHGAMIPHAGTGTRVWREVLGLGADLAKLKEVPDTRVPAEVAIVFDWPSWWALEIDSKPSRDLRLLERVQAFYEPLYQRNVPVDFVAPDGDFAAYRALLVPNLYLLKEETARRLEHFVAQGGTLVVSFFSGIADHNDHVYLDGYPAPLRRLLGLRVEEFDPYPPGQTNVLTTVGGRSYSCDLWSDIVDLEGAQAVASFAQDFYAGRPAVTRHLFGRGLAYYIGTRPEPAYLAALLQQVCDEAGVAPPYTTPHGVEAVRRVGGDRAFLFLLNHSRTSVEVPLTCTMRDVLSDRLYAGTLRLEPYGVSVLTEA